MKTIFSITAVALALFFSYPALAQENPKPKAKKNVHTISAQQEVKQDDGKKNMKTDSTKVKADSTKKKGKTRMAITNKGLPTKQKMDTEVEKKK